MGLPFYLFHILYWDLAFATFITPIAFKVDVGTLKFPNLHPHPHCSHLHHCRYLVPNSQVVDCQAIKYLTVMYHFIDYFNLHCYHPDYPSLHCSITGYPSIVKCLVIVLFGVSFHPLSSRHHHYLAFYYYFDYFQVPNPLNEDSTNSIH